jgi:hypothetical protein
MQCPQSSGSSLAVLCGVVESREASRQKAAEACTCPHRTIEDGKATQPSATVAGQGGERLGGDVWESHGSSRNGRLLSQCDRTVL